MLPSHLSLDECWAASIPDFDCQADLESDPGIGSDPEPVPDQLLPL